MNWFWIMESKQWEGIWPHQLKLSQLFNQLYNNISLCSTSCAITSRCTSCYTSNPSLLAAPGCPGVRPSLCEGHPWRWRAAQDGREVLRPQQRLDLRSERPLADRQLRGVQPQLGHAIWGHVQHGHLSRHDGQRRLHREPRQLPVARWALRRQWQGERCRNNKSASIHKEKGSQTSYFAMIHVFKWDLSENIYQERVSRRFML